MISAFDGTLINGWMFARRLLIDGIDPLEDPGTLASFVGQVKGLLNVRKIAVDMASFLRDQTADGEGLAGVDEAFSSQATRLAVKALGDVGAVMGLEICLILPGLSRMTAISGTPDDEDDLDEAGMIVADFLRIVAVSGISVVLLDDQNETGVDFLGPVINVAKHNNIDLALSVAGVCIPQPDLGIPHVFGKGLTKCRFGEDEWTKFRGWVDGQSVYVCIPERADPDEVQRTLS